MNKVYPNNISHDLISALFFEIIKRETKALFEPTDDDELHIEVNHRLL